MSGGALAERFTAARREGRALLIGYLPAGFPSYDGCLEAFAAIVDAGVDAVEIGLPYSDPVLDGPTIQRAAEQALRAGVRTETVLDTVDAVAGTGVPAFVMTYWNPVLRYGVDRFADDLRAAGGAGVITPDLLPDEAGEWLSASDRTELDRIFLVAPSSTSARLQRATAACRGFVYATSVMGVTGAREATSTLAPDLVARTRAVSDLPVGVGLGVSNGAQAAQVAGYADAVIVGSAFVRQLLEDDAPDLGPLRALAGDLAAGVRRPVR